MFSNTMLLHLGSQNPIHYLLTTEEMEELDYNLSNEDLNQPISDTIYCIAFTCEKLSKILEKWAIVLLNIDEKILFEENITINIENLKLEENSLRIKEIKSNLESIIKNGIIIGYDLGECINKLNLNFSHVIDVVNLYPHRELLPNKRILKDINYEIYHYELKSVAYEIALSSLRIAKKHIDDGKGKFLRTRFVSNDSLFSEVSLELIYEKFKFEPKTISNVYLRGSRLIGTNGLRFDGSISDWDFVVVINTNSRIHDVHLNYGNLDIAAYDYKTFAYLVEENVIWSLECIFAPEKAILKNDFNFRKTFIFNPTKLRSSVSYEASKQVAKGKRNRCSDLYKGFKCIFIALRFYHYGIEILQKKGSLKTSGVLITFGLK